MKKCTKCGEDRELSEFYNNRNYKSGLNSTCKICDKLKDRLRNRRSHCGLLSPAASRKIAAKQTQVAKYGKEMSDALDGYSDSSDVGWYMSVGRNV